MGIIKSLFGNKNKPAAPSVTWSDVEPLVASYKRTAWYPETVEKSSPRSASKFSGVPFLSKTEEWPRCGHCQQPMQLFLQLNSNDLPAEAETPFGDGYLQVFYCTNDEMECEIESEAYFPFSASTLVRVVDFNSASENDVINSPVKDAFPEKEITGWKPHDDYPNWEELEESGCNLSDEQSEVLAEKNMPLPKDKLLGWPFWVQGVEYPDCPDCGKPMSLIFQIDSEDNLPYMFGDVGCSHITQCKEHQDKMAIAWACS